MNDQIEVDIEPGIEIPLQDKWGYPKVLPKKDSRRK